MTTPVIFRVFLKRKDCFDGTELIALFPTVPGTRNADTCESYMHIGQHSSATVALFYAATRPATPDEYLPLLRELESIGYDDLRVYRRYQPSFTAERIKAIR